MGGVHGLDPWLEKLGEIIAVEPEVPSVDAALDAVVALLGADAGVDIGAVKRAMAKRLNAPPGAWHPEDWRHSHPEFPPKLALAMFVYTLHDPNVYAPLGDALHGADRSSGPGGVSVRVRAWLPFAKLLDVALEQAALVPDWGYFIGQVFRGVKFAFPKPTVSEHNPVAYFPKGREMHWFEFNSSATEFEVMYQPWFCGKSGPRTVFTIQSCEGVSIRRFSHIPDEEEVLFRPGAHFRVTASSKRLTAADLGPNPPAAGGFPDDVHLEQIPTNPAHNVAAMRRALQSAEQLNAQLRAEAAAKDARIVQLQHERDDALQQVAELERLNDEILRGVPEGPTPLSRKAGGGAIGGGAAPPAEATLRVDEAGMPAVVGFYKEDGASLPACSQFGRQSLALTLRVAAGECNGKPKYCKVRGLTNEHVLACLNRLAC
jgi:hypothetical protein